MSTAFRHLKFFVSTLLCVWGMHRAADAELEIPPITSLVMDQGGFLSPEGKQRLERALTSYQQQTGHQFALLTVSTLDGASIEDFAIRVAERWELGDEQRDDGLILVLAKAERKMRIEVGYGLEGAIPDAIAARVIRYELTPAFQRGEIEQGIFSAFDVLIKKAAGEAVRIGPGDEQEPAPSSGFSVFALIFWGLLFFVGSRSGFGGALMAGMLLGGGTGRRGGGGFGGGGFGGGGGGGFGGGGASGGW